MQDITPLISNLVSGAVLLGSMIKIMKNWRDGLIITMFVMVFLSMYNAQEAHRHIHQVMIAVGAQP